MSASSTTVSAPGTISPKVFWPLVVSVVLVFVSTFLSALTPELLADLGPVAFPLGLALGAVSQTITGYLKGDELRDHGVRATAAVFPSDVVAPFPGTALMSEQDESLGGPGTLG